MSCSGDWVLNPLGVIDELFEENNGITSENIRDYFSKLLENKTSMRQIPSLNDVPSHELLSGSLVRFRCMVQDMFDPEFYLGKYIVRQMKTGEKRSCCGLYRDLITADPDEEEIDFDAPDNVTVDRQTLYCIPIPGENVWAKEIYSKMCPRQRDMPDVVSRQKRSHNDDEDVSEVDQELMETDGASGSSNKRSKRSDLGGTDDSSSGASLPAMNFPLSSEQGTACILKIYDPSCNLKLNDIAEVVGIISTDPNLAYLFKQQESSAMVPEFMEILEEADARNPPPSLVPRIHTVLVQNLNHNNPYLEPDVTSFGEAEDGTEAIREQVVTILEQMLLGDRLAAEYLLCHLISTVYHRQDVVALGKFTLNLSKCPSDGLFTTSIYKVISDFVAKSHNLALSLANVNTLKFVPRKDYKLNRLQTGLLQLCDRTHLVVDETALQPGQLEANGVNNITALGSVILWQKLDYDFDFHKQTFPTNIVMLVLSEGKSVLQCDCHIPILPSSSNISNFNELFDGISVYLTPALLEQIRTYLGKAQLCTYSISNDIQKIIEEDFVDTRKEDKQAMTVDDFHTLLTLTRLLSLSYGKASPTEEIWMKAKAMEITRKERIAQLK